MRATVKPAKLREGLSQKLGAAGENVGLLRQAELPELNGHWDPAKYAIAFLHAARGVCATAETFANGHGIDFKAWYAAWRASVSAADLQLWDRLRDDRVAQEHGDGADFIAVAIPITRGPGMPEMFRNNVLYGGGAAPPASKGGIRFSVDPNRPTSEVCADYLRVARRFVDDFLRNYAHLIP